MTSFSNKLPTLTWTAESIPRVP